jgi:NAD-dependent SIR2 family protein deacetylase
VTPVVDLNHSVQQLTEFIANHRVLVLSGAGCSTESGIPDYRGAGRPEPPRVPIQHAEFLRDPQVRQRYWARASLGWSRFSSVKPNSGHVSLAELEASGRMLGVITQNVDRLHQAAGSRRVVELHGALADVICLGCGNLESRSSVHQRLIERNPNWLERAADMAPDGDAEISAELVTHFEVVDCQKCGGVLKPAVVFFGGNVAPSTLQNAWSMFDEANALLVLGSSLAVYSGFRFARRASERRMPLAIVNQGPTRADSLPLTLRIDARLGEILPRVAQNLRG